MDPIKIEDNIREKLQEREITPSKTAWEKLETQLELIPQKKTSKTVWFGIAAGFIGIVIIASFMFNNDVISSQNDPTIVVELIDGEALIPLEDETNNRVAEENVETIKLEKPSEEFLKNNTNRKEVVLIEEEKTPSIKKEFIVEETAITSSENTKNTPTTKLNKEENYIDTKVNEVVAQVLALKENNNSVDAKEIDALLLNAQKELSARRILNKEKIDAVALLNIVETELETSFRDKVFEALDNGYEKVRTAVVERQN